MTRIRRAAAADLPGVFLVEKECFRDESFPRSYFSAYLRRANVVFLVAGDAGEYAGYVVGAIDGRYRRPAARLDSIAVREGWRGRGLGRRLLQRFEREMRRRGAKSVVLQVSVNNDVARSLYLGSGYEVQRGLPDFYGRGRDGVEMRKSLTPPRST